VFDPNGTSWLEPSQHRSPAGNLYENPTQEPTLTVPLSGHASLRLYDYYEHGQISDWHYAGFSNSLVYAAHGVGAPLRVGFLTTTCRMTPPMTSS
jgi:hypothetical protein